MKHKTLFKLHRYFVIPIVLFAILGLFNLMDLILNNKNSIDIAPIFLKWFYGIYSIIGFIWMIYTLVLIQTLSHSSDDLDNLTQAKEDYELATKEMKQTRDKYTDLISEIKLPICFHNRTERKSIQDVDGYHVREICLDCGYVKQ